MTSYERSTARFFVRCSLESTIKEPLFKTVEKNGNSDKDNVSLQLDFEPKSNCSPER